MRDIKFRGKRVDNGEWVYGYYCFIGYTNLQKHYIIPDYASAFYGFEVIPETVGQYTGLHDKNGKEIYEDDIVQVYIVNNHKAGICEIKYINRSFCMSQNKEDTELDCIWYNICEVIGNIYENDDLLNQ